MSTNNIRYLGNHAERIKTTGQLREGELYAIGRGRDAFVAFVMPGEEQIDRKGRFDAITVNGVDIYEATLTDDGERLEESRVQQNSSLHIDEFLDFNHMGVFRPTKRSELRMVIEEGLANGSELEMEEAE